MEFALLHPPGAVRRATTAGESRPVIRMVTPVRQALTCGLLAMLLDVVLAAYRFDVLAHGELVDPDSYMRLVRLDDIVAAHAPLDVVARDASGAGTVLHWSHLLDNLLLLMAAPLAPWLGEHAALHWAGVMLGPL